MACGKPDKPWFNYMVRCSDRSLYVGSTNDVPRRFRTHLSGKGSKYVRSRLPAHLVWAQRVGSKEGALRREARLKRMTKAEKEGIVTQANPMLEFWRRNNVSMEEILKDVLRLSEVLDRRMEASNRWSWAVPNEEALSELVRLSPIVEIGAGTGYWAHLLRSMGADVVAYDASPPDTSLCNVWHPGASSTHTRVDVGNEEMAARHPDRTLFLCWPPRGDMARKCLRHYRGETLVVVGEPSFGTCADATFGEELLRNFILSGTIQIPRWICINDVMMVWKRRET